MVAYRFAVAELTPALEFSRFQCGKPGAAWLTSDVNDNIVNSCEPRPFTGIADDFVFEDAWYASRVVAGGGPSLLPPSYHG